MVGQCLLLTVAEIHRAFSITTLAPADSLGDGRPLPRRERSARGWEVESPPVSERVPKIVPKGCFFDISGRFGLMWNQ